MKAVALIAACGLILIAAGLAPVDSGAQSPPAPPVPAPDAKIAPWPDERTLPTVTTALMFSGRAEEAMMLYISLFPNSKVIAVERWLAGEEGGDEGTIKHALFSLDGQTLRCMENSFPHPFTFTPSTSLFVSCDSAEEIDRLFAGLSKDGEVLMPLQAYDFARKFAWVNDRFGVSWQLILPN